MNTNLCRCGQPLTWPSLPVHHRRPRKQYEPMAVDPWYIHGFWPIRSCGSVGCQADGYAELLATYPEADVFVGDGFEYRFIVDDEAGGAA